MPGGDVESMGSVFSLVRWVWLWIVRPSFKWLLHVVSGHSEIERIMYNKQKSRVLALRNLDVTFDIRGCGSGEWSLRRSRSASMRDLLCCPPEAVNSAVYVVVRQKCVPKNDLPVFQPRLSLALSQLLGYYGLTRRVEWLRQVRYDSANPEHEQLLLKLWSALRPHEPLTARISKQWQEIGFQGSDPATDFRGMGLLGLIQLVHFCSEQGDVARRVFGRSTHPRQGYPFAIAGINLTKLLRELLQEGHLKSHLYNRAQGPADLAHFNDAYCSVYCLFDELWHRGDPPDVMAFNLVTAKLGAQLRAFLARDSALLPSCLSVESY